MRDPSRQAGLNIAFVGLATSHPYSDAAALLRRRPHAHLHVWEEDAERANKFLRDFPSSYVHRDIESVGALSLDGAIITLRPPAVSSAISRFSAAEIPLFVNKPAAASLEQLSNLDRVVRPIANRVLSTSVLRFAPQFVGFKAGIDIDQILAVQATVRHDVGRWLHGSTAWQDDVSIGGGSIVTIGIHGFELLVSILGPEFEVIASRSAVRYLDGLESEDVAVVTIQWANGILGAVTLVGVAANENYSITVETVNGPMSMELPATGVDPFGYGATIDAFLTMVDDFRGGRVVQSPVEWYETVAVLEGVVTAARVAHPDKRSRQLSPDLHS